MSSADGMNVLPPDMPDWQTFWWHAAYFSAMVAHTGHCVKILHQSGRAALSS